jgi:hypothetical protein
LPISANRRILGGRLRELGEGNEEMKVEQKKSGMKCLKFEKKTVARSSLFGCCIVSVKWWNNKRSGARLKDRYAK